MTSLTRHARSVSTRTTVSAFRRRGAATIAALLLAYAVPAAASDAPGETPYRIFLKDGTPIVTYGEYVRTDDRVVFTIPLGPADGPTSLQLITLPAGAVDWDRTDRYTDAARYERYATARGERDYAALTAEVARALAEMAATTDPARRLAVATRSRQLLLGWPAAHYGYRASDVRDMSVILDETISSLRASAGERSFDLALVATVRAPELEPLPAPNLADSLAGALAIARLADVPAERMSLQHAILSVLRRHRQELTAGWAKTTRKAVAAALKADLRDEQRYRRLSLQTLKDATGRAARGDVDGVERALAELRRKDQEYGGRRPAETVAATAAVAAQLDAARAMRLALDRHAMRTETYRAYRRDVNGILRDLGGVRRELEAVRAMAGPSPGRLRRLSERVGGASRRLAMLVSPPDLRDAHAALLSAAHLMGEAARIRLEAITSADMQMARNASAAAAGSLLLLSRAKAAVDDYFTSPRRR